jgi:hypothetical protein
VILAGFLTALLIGGSARAALPLLQFVPSVGTFPLSFESESGLVVADLAGFETNVHCATSHGKGELTGPRSAVSAYRFTGCVAQHGSKIEAKCSSEGAAQEEIRTGPIAGELVWLSQAAREVGILMNPGGGIYMTFQCGGESTEARGPFLAPVAPISGPASTLTATLAESGAAQTPNEYEGADGQRHAAIPEGKRGSHEWVTTGVAATIQIHPHTPVTIKAVTAAEAEAEQRSAEAQAAEARRREAIAARKHEEELAAAEQREAGEAAARERADRKKLEEEAITAMRHALSRALALTDRARKIGAVLAAGGLTLKFSSSESGKLVIRWWLLPPGAHLTRAHKPPPVLVAGGNATFPSPGIATVKIALTREGRRLLGRGRSIKVASRIRFTPPASAPIGVSGQLLLGR